jgi:hypothetical protein
MTPLNSPAVDSLQLEASVMKLWNEFLLRWFDGAAHTVGTQTGAVFPRVALRFQQSAQPQPLDQGTTAAPGAGITVVWTAPARWKRGWEPRSNARAEIATGEALFLFYVRAEVTETGGGQNSESLCRTVSDLLFGLLENGHACLPLGAKGIRHLQPVSPVLVAGAAGQSHALRLVSCRAKLRHVIPSQVEATP